MIAVSPHSFVLVLSLRIFTGQWVGARRTCGMREGRSGFFKDYIYTLKQLHIVSEAQWSEPTYIKQEQ
jgi:hypothetical protein